MNQWGNEVNNVIYILKFSINIPIRFYSNILNVALRHLGSNSLYDNLVGSGDSRKGIEKLVKLVANTVSFLFEWGPVTVINFVSLSMKVLPNRRHSVSTSLLKGPSASSLLLG